MMTSIGYLTKVLDSQIESNFNKESDTNGSSFYRHFLKLIVCKYDHKRIHFRLKSNTQY